VDALCKLIARLDLDQLSEEEILEIARLLSALSIVTAQLNGLALTFSALLAARTPRRGPLDSPNHWFGPN
jgi:hypothetical protein